MPKTNGSILTNHSELSQAKSKETFSNQRYSTYSNKEYDKIHYQIQFALRDKVLSNEIGFILECFSGVRRRNLLKTILFLVTNSQHQFIRISHERLAIAIGVSSSQMKRYIRKFKEATFLTVISEQHTKKNRLPNMYQISPIFFQDNLKKQLMNMLAETQENFRDPRNNIIKEELNYNSISTTSLDSDSRHKRGSTQNIGNILFKVLQNRNDLRSACRVGAHLKDSQCFEVDSSLRSEIPEKEKNLNCGANKAAVEYNCITEEKAVVRDEFLSYFEQFKDSFVN